MSHLLRKQSYIQNEEENILLLRNEFFIYFQIYSSYQFFKFHKNNIHLKHYSEFVTV